MTGLYALFAFTVSTTLVTLMAVFLGSDSLALGYALLFQAVVGVLALIIFISFTLRTLRHVQFANLISEYRRLVPGWIWFVFWSINSLMIAGELAFAVTRWANVEQTPWLHHAPLIGGVICTCAMLAMYVDSQQKLNTT